MDPRIESVLTEKELARRWAVSVGTLRNRRRAGTSPPWFRPLGSQSGPVRYRLADIEQWERKRLKI